MESSKLSALLYVRTCMRLVAMFKVKGTKHQRSAYVKALLLAIPTACPNCNPKTFKSAKRHPSGKPILRQHNFLVDTARILHALHRHLVSCTYTPTLSCLNFVKVDYPCTVSRQNGGGKTSLSGFSPPQTGNSCKGSWEIASFSQLRTKRKYSSVALKLVKPQQNEHEKTFRIRHTVGFYER